MKWEEEFGFFFVSSRSFLSVKTTKKMKFSFKDCSYFSLCVFSFSLSLS